MRMTQRTSPPPRLQQGARWSTFHLCGCCLQSNKSRAEFPELKATNRLLDARSYHMYGTI